MQDTVPILVGVRDLPALSPVAVRLMELLHSPQSSMVEISEVLSREPSLTTSVLRYVNSSQYGLSNRVSSLSHALCLLGFRAVRNIVLTAAVADLFRKPPRSPCMNMSLFAVHSIAAAVVARRLASYTNIGEPEQSYTLGLLHDIGKLVLDQCYPDDYLRAIAFARRSHQPSWMSERSLIGYDHAAVGAALAETWKLPPDIVEGIRRHHETQAAVENELYLIAHITEYVCWVKGYRCHDAFAAPELNEAAWRRLHLDARALTHLLSALDIEIQSACEMFLSARPEPKA